MKKLLSGEKRRLMIAVAAIVFAAILFYVLLLRFPAVRSALSKVRKVTAPILYGLCFAFIVNLPMSFFERKLFDKLRRKRPRLARWFSIIISYVLVLGLIGLLIALVVPKVTESIIGLVSHADVYVGVVSKFLQEMTDNIAQSPEAYAILEKVIANLLQRLNAFAVNAVPQIPKLTFSIIGLLYNLLVTLVISIHSLIHKERLMSFARRIATATVPEGHIDGFLGYCSYANATFKKYIVGQLSSCIVIGILCYIGMRIFGMPYPELISVFICAAALIPIIGPWVSIGLSALIILMASFSNPWKALWFIIMMIVIQLFDDNVVYPRILGGAIGVPGLLVLAAVIVAGGLFGIPGLLIAVPTAAVIRKVFNDWVDKRNAQRAENDGPVSQDEATPAEG